MTTHTMRRTVVRLAAIAVLLTGAGLAASIAGPGQQAQAGAAVSYRYTLTNVNSGKCLDVAYGGKDNLGPVVQYTCYGGPIQQWRLTYLASAGAYTLTNVNSGKCLDVAYGGKDNFGPVVQYACHRGPIQQWRLRSLGV